MQPDTPVLDVSAVSKAFPLPSKRLFGRPRRLHAVSGVDLRIGAGATLSLVGESGCGKSTLGRIVAGLAQPDCGQVLVEGVARAQADKAQARELLRKVQLVFQDPVASLSPRRTVAQILAEPLQNFGLCESRKEAQRQVLELLDKVRLPASAADRLPHEFSGGQRQRVAIARALASSPRLIVCDEAVSALDVSVKAQIVNLLLDLQDSEGVALLFISHDLAIVEQLTDRVAVMYLGRIVEIGSREAVFGNPRHPYTRALLSAIPVPEVDSGRRRILLTGDVPSPTDLPAGCAFAGRCPRAAQRCLAERPQLQSVAGLDHAAACHFAQED